MAGRCDDNNSSVPAVLLEGVIAKPVGGHGRVRVGA